MFGVIFRIFAGTESESDVGSHHSRHRHHHHRHHGQSAESVNDLDPRWHCYRPIIHGSQLHGYDFAILLGRHRQEVTVTDFNYSLTLACYA